ncbi:hypothetical protein [Massilia sp. DWR3-1-1]|uniref:hypothetical protein n=1 Tax=Massilia sp. DWR3-1-1 TaxID=2804559 RepID=UPI003CF21D8D
MKAFYGLPEVERLPGRALAIGNFDGVHRGHQAIIEKLNTEAARRCMPSCVLTFEPHPRDYFAQLTGRAAGAVKRITSSEEKLAALARYGVDQVLVLPFDRWLASCSSQGFIDAVLVRGLSAAYVIVGDDFQFGAGRTGNFDTLAAAGHRTGFDAESMPAFPAQGARISSTLIRLALARGDVATAEQLLGRELSQGRKPRAQLFG